MSKTECFPEALEEGRPGVSAQAPLGGYWKPLCSTQYWHEERLRPLIERNAKMFSSHCSSGVSFG